LIEKEYPQDFYQLKNNVKKLLGFNSEQYKNTYLNRRFQSRLRVHKLDSFNEYWDFLKHDKQEQEILQKDLTINVTEFFRDNTVYEELQKNVLPKVLEQNSNRKIRIWSAGSSDGKEAYSIAIICSKLLKNDDLKKRVEIIGTDIDRDSLRNASNGIYSSRPGIQQTDISKQLKFLKNPNKYFDFEENTYRVKPEIKQLVRFAHHDLISDRKKRNFDIIFCRNVVIYFTRELQTTLYKDFYDALNHGGYFVMGKTETLIGESRELFEPFNSRERIFVKP
jgi:chemotaxis protein methyltransferase CheR